MVRAVIDDGLSKAAVADRYRTTPKTVAKWVGCFRAEGVEGLRDRSSRPLSLPSQTGPATCAAIEALRRQRHTGKQIAAARASESGLEVCCRPLRGLARLRHELRVALVLGTYSPIWGLRSASIAEISDACEVL
jgi:transposase